MARQPTLKIGMFIRDILKLAKAVKAENIDEGTPITRDLGALVRDLDGNRKQALMTSAVRRGVIDPMLDLKNLSKYVRPGRDIPTSGEED